MRLPLHSTAEAAYGGFAAKRHAGTRYRSTAGAGAQQQRRRSTALSSKRGQCHVESRVTRLSRLVLLCAQIIEIKETEVSLGRRSL